MSEKLADDDGLTRLASYLAANAYTSGNSGTFAVASDADLETVLTTGESTDWNDKASVVKAIGYRTGYPNPVHGICNYVHVPGNSRIFEYMVNTQDTNIGQNGPVSQPSGACYVPYYLNAINNTKLFSNSTTRKANEIKAKYDVQQAVLNEHIAKYKGSSDTSMFTNDDEEYVKNFAYYFGTSSSTESSWTYVLDKKYTSWVWWDWEENYKSLSGMIYNETKVRERIRMEKIRNKQYFRLLFGDFDAYIAYLSGGAS